MPRFQQIRACDHHLCTANIECALHNIMQVVLMRLFAMIHAPKDWVAQVDANL
jgi:hypothetical protein